ncbi:hypothetical protein EV401DRAFT_1883474, partial [Pisolithus croceorrhizus]
IDDATVIPPYSAILMEKGYDVTVRDYVRVACSPAMGVEGPVHHVDLCCLKKVHCTLLSSVFCLKVRDYSLQDAERQVGHEVWIISSPNKGYRGTLRSVGRTSCKVAIHSGLVQFKNTAVVTESGMLLNGSSTSVYDPWVVQPDDLTPQRPNEAEQQLVDDESACPTIAVHCTSKWSCTTAPDHFSTIEDGPAPPSHIAVTVTSSTVSANIERHFIPARYLTPANLTSAGQYCLVLRGTLTSQIFRVKKCQSKKEPKGVELNGGAKLPFGDVCQVVPCKSQVLQSDHVMTF